MDVLCRLSDVKSYLDIADAQTASDAKLTELITGVSAYAAQLAQIPGRDDGDDASFFAAYYQEHYDGPGGQVLLLRHCAPATPVTSVLAVTIGDAAIPKARHESSAGFTFDRFSVRLRGYRFVAGQQNVSVRYLAGSEPDSTLGQALRSGAAEWVASIYKERPHIGIQSKTLDRETVTFFQKTMPVRMAAILDTLKLRYAA